MGECARQTPNKLPPQSISLNQPFVYSILQDLTCDDITRKLPTSVKMVYVHSEPLASKDLENKLRVTE
jgi:hypothetical protein